MQYLAVCCILQEKNEMYMWKMKNKSVLFVMLTVLSVLAVSCVDDLEPDDRLIIEPENVPMFQFDADGVPYRYENPALSKEMQETLRKEFVGYGWKWRQTFEILEDGYLKPEDFYAGLIGPSPSSLYVKSSTEYIRYFHSDTVNKDVFWQQACSFKPETGILDDLRIWSVYTLSGKWYMDCVEPLCQRNAGDGTYKTVWGCSHFVRMTNAELQQMQQTYIFDYSQNH